MIAKHLKFRTIEFHVSLYIQVFTKETESTFTKQRCFNVLSFIIMLGIFAEMFEILPQPLNGFIILPEFDITKRNILSYC